MHRVVGTITEEIALVETAGPPALRRTQVLESVELGDRRSETTVIRESFLPHSHLDVTEAYTLTLSYHGTRLAGEKRFADRQVVPIDASVESPVFDAHSVEMVLRVLPLADGYAAELPVFHAGRGVEMVISVRVLGREMLRSAGDGVDTWRVRTDWEGVTQYYWVGARSRELLRQSSQLSEGVQLEFVR
jgi:hypothetical protein